MITVKALKASQNGKTLYLTVLRVDEVRQLRGSEQLDIETFDPARPPQRQGYQRKLDSNKINQIADFISRTLEEPGAEVLLPIMPTAVVLNCRPSPGSMLRFDAERSELTITDRAILYVVDGQHRLEGIKESTLQEGYAVPVIIVEELNIVQEAAQFLTINSKQTRVRPDLQLRVLYNFDDENTQKLVDILRVDHWKMQAQALAIALNDRNESPWRNLVRRPNEVTGGWKPIREAGFIDTLRPICEPRGPLARVDTRDKENFLIEYWEAIRQLYEEAFRQDTGRRYHICRTIGAGIFHTVAPLIFNLRALHPRRALVETMRPVVRRGVAPLRDWARRTGKFSREAARRGTYVARAAEFAVAIEPRLDLVDLQALHRLQRRTLGQANEKILSKAEALLRPISVRRFDSNRTQETGQRGCYCLIKVRGQTSEAYVGKGDNIGHRLGGYHGYDLYNIQTAGSAREMEALEAAAYHLLRPAIRTNENHPPPEDACPFC